LNSATRVSSQSRWPRKVGEFPAAANTGAVASWAALKWSVNRSGSTRRWSWKEVLAPSRPTSSAASSRGSAPSIRIRNGSWRSRRRPLLRAR
jgi:hypothetical protein